MTKKQDKTEDEKVTKDPKVAELESKVEELEGGWKRALADYQNLKKRSEEEHGRVVAFANGILIEKLLPVLDSLEKLGEHVSNAGLELTTKDFKQVLKDAGLSEIEIGENFDPLKMEAVEIVEGEKNKVIEVSQKGYLLNENLIRPAKVKVGGGK